MPHKTPHNLRAAENERAQALVEFTLVLPLLALLAFGIVQFGLAFNNYITITDAARAGARKAAVSRDIANPAGAATDAAEASAGNLDQSKLGVSVSSTWQPASDVTVTVTYPYTIHLLGLYDWSGQLTSKVTERVE